MRRFICDVGKGYVFVLVVFTGAGLIQEVLDNWSEALYYSVIALSVAFTYRLASCLHDLEQR